MGRKASPNSGAATIDKLYPNIDPLTREKLINKLKTYSGKDYRDKTFPKGLIQFERAEVNSDKNSGVFYPESSLKYVKNLLELDELTGKNDKATWILNSKDTESRKEQREFLLNRFKELKYRGEQYLMYAKSAEEITDSVLSDKDPLKVSLFELPQKSDPVAETKELNDSIKEISFIGLSSLEMIEIIERYDNLTEPALNAHKSVLYFQEGNTELARECATESLKTDSKNGLAWMVLGYLALKGGKEARKVEMIHKELGANENTVSAEEQWHQGLLEDAQDCRELHLNRACEYFLKAWCYLPNTKICRIPDMHDLKPNMVSNYFKYASINKFDKKLLKTAAQNNFADLQLLYRTNTTLFLTRALPIIHSVDIESAKKIASDFVKCIRNSKPWRLGIDPTDPTMDDYLIAAGENLMHLQNLSPALPFEEVETFMKEVDNRFKEVCRISRIKNYSEFYRKQILKSDDKESMKVCRSALQSIPFDTESEYDQRLLKQWKYLSFSIPIHHAIKLILNAKSTTPPEKIAKLLTESVTPELLDAIVGEDYFSKVDDYDDLGDCEYNQDLSGKKFHVLHYCIQLLSEELFHPLDFENRPAEIDKEQKDHSAFSYVINYARKAKKLNSKQSGKLKALYQHWKELDPVLHSDNSTIQVITPENISE